MAIRRQQQEKEDSSKSIELLWVCLYLIKDLNNYSKQYFLCLFVVDFHGIIYQNAINRTSISFRQFQFIAYLQMVSICPLIIAHTVILRELIVRTDSLHVPLDLSY